MLKGVRFLGVSEIRLCYFPLVCSTRTYIDMKQCDVFTNNNAFWMLFVFHAFHMIHRTRCAIIKTGTVGGTN